MKFQSHLHLWVGWRRLYLHHQKTNKISISLSICVCKLSPAEKKTHEIFQDLISQVSAIKKIIFALFAKTRRVITDHGRFFRARRWNDCFMVDLINLMFLVRFFWELFYLQITNDHLNLLSCSRGSAIFQPFFMSMNTIVDPR